MPQEKTPTTLDELEEQLSKDELSPEVVRAESQLDDDLPPPDPRAAGTAVKQQPAVKDPLISDNDLEDAAAAADEADEDAPTENDLPKQRLHLEANPNAPRKPFWRRKRFWFGLLLLLAVAGAFAWFIRPSRLIIVNTLGLRAHLTITTGTVPEEGQQSAVLKNVAVTVNDQTLQTNSDGTASAAVNYGDVQIGAKKAGYQDAQQTVLIDFDPFFYLLGGKKADDAARSPNLQLKAVGIVLKFQAKDWLSDLPLTAGTFSVGDIVAKPNDQGIVQITIPATDAKSMAVKTNFGGSYNDKTFDIALDNNQTTITFVPVGKDYFVSNRSGVPAIYSADLDGGNIAEAIPASNKETADLSFAISPSGKYGILASTRDSKRDDQNTLLQQVYVVDLSTKKMTSVDQGKWVNFVDWLGDTLVYTVGEHQPGATGVTQRLAAVDATSNKRTNLSTAHSYGALRVAVDSVLYQVNYPNSDADYGSKHPELRTVAVKGGTEKNLGYKVQQLAQADADRFAYRAADGAWHEYNVNTSQNKNASAPANTDRAFLATRTADGQTRLVVGSVDGNPALIRRSVANGQEKQLYANAAIKGPVHLVGSAVIFRMDNADYALSLNGGEPKKITGVTPVSSSYTPPEHYFSFF